MISSWFFIAPPLSIKELLRILQPWKNLWHYAACPWTWKAVAVSGGPKSQWLPPVDLGFLSKQ